MYTKYKIVSLINKNNKTMCQTE